MMILPLQADTLPVCSYANPHKMILSPDLEYGLNIVRAVGHDMQIHQIEEDKFYEAIEALLGGREWTMHVHLFEAKSEAFAYQNLYNATNELSILCWHLPTQQWAVCKYILDWDTQEALSVQDFMSSYLVQQELEIVLFKMNKPLPF